MKVSTCFASTAMAFALCVCAAGEALAVSAYWHGVRSNQWADGISGGKSNWYSKAPPNSNPREVPDNTATFAPGALQKSSIVNGRQAIGSVVFTPGNDAYQIIVSSRSRLAIQGKGLANGSETVPHLDAVGKKAVLAFTDSAKACHNSTEQVYLQSSDGGSIVFTDNATGFDPCSVYARQDGTVEFSGRASGGRMYVNAEENGAKIILIGHSTLGKSLVSVSRGRLVFRSDGPKGDGKVTARSIFNQSSVDVGIDKVTVENYVMSETGRHVLSFDPLAGPGTLVANTSAQLAGKLVVAGSKGAKPGTYVLIKCDDPLTGKFDKTSISGFGNKLDAKIEYTKKTVRLVVAKK